jgi:hypothetical protein
MSSLDVSFSFGPRDRDRGYFGRNVLAGLIAGIDEFRAENERNPGFRSLGPAMLGAFMWLDDPELVERIAGFPHACVVVTKQPRDKWHQARIDKLKPVLDRCPGFPADALWQLGGLVLREDGKAPVVGPYSLARAPWLQALRTIGYRKTGNRLVPILHIKMLLLGELWWHDEDGSGGVADVTGFRPQKLWLGSANGTASSRANLEFGMWVADPVLFREATRFLGGLLRHSEELDPDAPGMKPDLVEPDYDYAFAEALADYDEAGEDPW